MSSGSPIFSLFLLMFSFLVQCLLVRAMGLLSVLISLWRGRNEIRQHKVTTCIYKLPNVEGLRFLRYSLVSPQISQSWAVPDGSRRQHPVGSFIEDRSGQEGQQMSRGTSPSLLRSRQGRAFLAKPFILCQLLSGLRKVKAT